ncbi:hypothetical protein [Sphingomonas colocasiae]|uniref:Uncharacterized protein n=1 Tax=Sphingomonas colocasiae TaxID=1848973 RepID=A0ABS7PM11_9SPHN|nr:hypothetical protein [Sphingomonas colocasiae]MBY8822339.1 hypothetical protein [Sphingomonas colocasiae]
MIRNPRLRRGLIIAAGAVILSAWAMVAATIWLFEPSVALRTGIVLAAALLTEAIFWLGAAYLGVTMFDRFRIWRRKPRGGKS